jgi:glycosyltransferase involved in cell wall biosynthesis
VITISTLVYSLVCTLILGVFSYRLNRAFQRFRIRKMYTAAVESPSVSVCIPARNETHAMTQCLERVLASDYRKLEIIVFDDSSVDDTSFLIRSFAHAGVRFVAGSELPDGWLGKNHALEVLAGEASGTYVIFLDVDTHIKPTTISQLVGYAMTEDIQMVSVIPGRTDGWRMSVLFGHLRYFWELILARPFAPATSSSLWLIKRETLVRQFGGFEAIRANVAPESALAATLTDKKYHCLVDSPSLGVSYEKKWGSQLETSRRLLYPMIGARPFNGFLALVLLVILNSPLFIVMSSLVFGWGMLQIISAWILVVFMATYGVFTNHLWRQAWWMGGLLWPLVVFQELVLLIASIVGYARRSITWKGRLVTARSNSARAYVIDR